MSKVAEALLAVLLLIVCYCVEKKMEEDTEGDDGKEKPD